MGQYFKAIVSKGDKKISEDIENNAMFHAHKYANGLKLMEHSYVGNDLVESVMRFIKDCGKCRLVWAGDYADDEPVGDQMYLYGCRLKKLYQISDCYNEIVKEPEPMELPYYVLNHDKKQYVEVKDNGDWTIHPIPLLTAEGNGRGGGDYYGTNEELVGTWARDLIEVTNEIPQSYEELKPNFVE